MTNPNVPVTPAHVEDDPKYPYKAYVSAALAAVFTFVSLYLSQKGGKGGFTHDELLDALGAALLATGLLGGGTFLTPNPKRLKRNQVGEVTSVLGIVVAVLAILILIAVLARVL